MQKQPPEVFRKKGVLINLSIKKTPVLESLFNKVAGLQDQSHLEILKIS